MPKKKIKFRKGVEISEDASKHEVSLEALLDTPNSTHDKQVVLGYHAESLTEEEQIEAQAEKERISKFKEDALKRLIEVAPRVLTQKQLAVLNHTINGLKSQEIAKILEISRQTVEEHLQKAVKTLQNHFQAHPLP